MPNRKPPALSTLRKSARACRDCDLWRRATQTVFGEGPEDANILFVGEQAGDKEDLAGRPFVGPAGHLLDAVLADIGVDRSDIYVTNVVKHFKFELRGKRRTHKRANAAEVAACLHWLDRELERIRPRWIVCLGSLAAKVVLGSGFRLMQRRGEWIERDKGQWALATVHPAYVLRARIGARGEEEFARFRADLMHLRHPPGA
ncbi:DNA polymerase [Dokdonella fugitiva]|uniref:Type-4 uracil-DNA glycosylase n=1 Tax=Dokdonella fugitiva TaxID=328517 RepID=A0A839EQR7_9GAMM|nr:UdgX family uracil-DNA binding protein [Dokdonella fugitiva]MBA8886667.1 DNA polymerase [Dokdonella fugitiva]